MKKINRLLALSFVLAVGLVLTFGGNASADTTLALWDYNGNASFSSSTAWATSSNNPINSNSGDVGGVQNHVGSFRWGYNDGNQPSGGSGNYRGDPAGPETTGGVLADDDRYRFELVNNTTGLIWTVNTTGYTGVGISLGIYSSLNLTTSPTYTNSFKLGYTTDNGTNWSYTTFTYNGSSAWSNFALTNLPDGVDAFQLMLGADPTGSEILTVDYVKVTGVPIPAAAWLLGSGLVGLVAIKRRMKK